MVHVNLCWCWRRRDWVWPFLSNQHFGNLKNTLFESCMIIISLDPVSFSLCYPKWMTNSLEEQISNENDILKLHKIHDLSMSSPTWIGWWEVSEISSLFLNLYSGFNTKKEFSVCFLFFFFLSQIFLCANVFIHPRGLPVVIQSSAVPKCIKQAILVKSTEAQGCERMDNSSRGIVLLNCKLFGLKC